MNFRDRLESVCQWLFNQDTSFSNRLRSVTDGLALHAFWLENESTQGLSEFADQWSASQSIAALGYDPIDESYLRGGINDPLSEEEWNLIIGYR